MPYSQNGINHGSYAWSEDLAAVCCFWGSKSRGWYNDAYDCDTQERECPRAGISIADNVSYTCMGQRDIGREESSRSATFRLAADSEREGDEICRRRDRANRSNWTGIGLFSDGAGRSHQYKHAPQEIRRYHLNRGEGMRYHYVGGLEEVDNHGQDGINVLYLDWHGEFDARSWPSPLGCMFMRDDDPDWIKWEWSGAPFTGSNDACGCAAGKRGQNGVPAQ